MFRSLRLLLLTILVSLSLPALRCDAQKTAAQNSGGETPMRVEVRLQGMSQPSLQPSPTAEPKDVSEGTEETHPGSASEGAEPWATPSPSPSPSPTPTPSPSPTPEPTPFSLYWVSDAQVYAYRYPKIYNRMFAYMANAAAEQNALGVLMTGDLVDNRNEQRHWNHAKAAIGLLDGKLPVWCVAGNHDVGADRGDYSAFLSCGFCAAEEGDLLYKDGVCWYDTFTAAGQDFLLLGVGWQNNSDYLPWMKNVLENHPDHTAILLVHSFLTDNGNLTGTGKNLEKELLSHYPNLRLVLCGHNDGSARWEKAYEDGHSVNALMYNFQDDKKYGLGYIRILTFDPADRSLFVTTYSPWFDDYNYYKDETKDTFTLMSAW